LRRKRSFLCGLSDTTDRDSLCEADATRIPDLRPGDNGRRGRSAPLVPNELEIFGLEHRKIIDAIRKADPDKAESIVRSHVLKNVKKVAESA
jgi:hypothetical protein